MGFLTDMLRAKNDYTMVDFTNDIRALFRGRLAHSGVLVNEESALRYITVYSCVRVLAETLGTLPLDVYRKRPSGGSEQARDHPNSGLLHDLPNDEMTSLTWRETMMGHLTLSGNAYSVISFDGWGRVADIYPVDWHLVQPRRNLDTGKIEYQITDRGKPEIFPADRVFHVPGWGFNGVIGYSSIHMAQESVGLGLAQAEFAARFYGQGMNMGGLLEHPASLTDKAYERLKQSLEEEGAGLANAWRPLILEEGMKYSRIPMPLTEAQFIETRKFSRDEICGLYRVPPHMIANLERSTNNNIEHQSLEFVKYAMLPYITRWEQTINWKLFTPRERQQGFYAKFNLEGLLRGDYKSRQEGLAIQRQNGIINADEWREVEEMNPQEGGTGKIYLVNGAMVPVDKAGQEPATQLKGGEQR